MLPLLHPGTNLFPPFDKCSIKAEKRISMTTGRKMQGISEVKPPAVIIKSQ